MWFVLIVPLVHCAITKQTKYETQQDKTISQDSFKGKKQVFQLQPWILRCSRRRRGAYLTYIERSTGKNKGATAFKIFCTFRTLQSAGPNTLRQKGSKGVIVIRSTSYIWLQHDKNSICQRKGHQQYKKVHFVTFRISLVDGSCAWLLGSLDAGFFHSCSPPSTLCAREKKFGLLVTQKASYSPLTTREIRAWKKVVLKLTVVLFFFN
jgi:hypothetical protein